MKPIERKILSMRLKKVTDLLEMLKSDIRMMKAEVEHEEGHASNIDFSCMGAEFVARRLAVRLEELSEDARKFEKSA